MNENKKKLVFKIISINFLFCFILSHSSCDIKRITEKNLGNRD
jgi:hypothetical protein